MAHDDQVTYGQLPKAPHVLDRPYIPRLKKEAKASPTWMVSIDSMTQSKILHYEAYQNYCELLGYWSAEERSSTSAQQLSNLSDGKILLSNPFIIIPWGSYVPAIENKLIKNKFVEKIEIVHLVKDGDEIIDTQKITYRHCTILMVRHELDEVIICFNPGSVETTMFKHTTQQSSSQSMGQFSTVVYGADRGVHLWNKETTQSKPLSRPIIPRISLKEGLPHWVVAIDAPTPLFSSEVKGYEQFTDLHGFLDQITLYFQASQTTSKMIAGASAAIETPFMIIPTGTYYPTLLDALRFGKLIPRVRVLLLGTIEEKPTPLQQFNFFKCKIDFLEQEFDDLYLSFECKKREHIVYSHDDNGAIVGNTVSELSLTDDN